MRSFGRGEEETLLGILSEAFGSFVDLTQPRKAMASRFFDPDSCFIAEEDGSPVGCVALTSLPRENWYVVRYLAVKQSKSRVQIAEKLLSKVLEYVGSKRPEFLRAATPAIQPYVDLYKREGFQPVRRDFRIAWDLKESHAVQNIPISLLPVTKETAREAAGMFVRSDHWLHSGIGGLQSREGRRPSNNPS